jgi:hypothetical protein
MTPPNSDIRSRSKFIASGIGLLLASCSSPFGETRSLPLAEGQRVTSVSVDAHVPGKPPVKTTLTEAKDITFVVNHLRDLEFRTYSRSTSEIDITLHVTGGEMIEREVGADGIGPKVPTSGYMLHWFPKDDSLYRFIVKRAYPR